MPDREQPAPWSAQIPKQDPLAEDCEAPADLLDAMEAAFRHVAPADCPHRLGELERLKAILWQCLMATEPAGGARTMTGPLGRILTMPQVAAVLAIHEDRAHELARQGRIRTVHIGKYVRVTETDLNYYVEPCR